MTEFFKRIGLKFEGEWLKILDEHGFQRATFFLYDDVVSDHTYYYHQTEHETGGPIPASFIFLWMKGHRRTTLRFEEGVLHSITVPANSMVSI